MFNLILLLIMFYFIMTKIKALYNFYSFISLFVPQTENTKSMDRATFFKRIHAKKIALQKEAKVYPIRTKFTPQSMVNNVVLMKFYDHLRKNFSDKIMDKLEGLITLYFALADCSTQRQFISIMTLYAKTHCDKSLMSSITDLSNSLFTVSPQSSDRPEWLELLSTSLTNWKLVTNNPGFSKVSKVISMMVTLGIFGEQKISLGGLELFSTHALKQQVNAVDFFDAVADTITFFAEGAYSCFLTGSLKPLLFSSSAVMEIESRYIEMLSLWEYARNGNLKRFMNMDEAEFDCKLKQLVTDLEQLYKGSPVGAERKILSDRWRQMASILTEFESSRVRGGLRKSPFTFKVFGESSVGKSSFTDVLMYSLLKACGFPAGDDYVITLNPDDKHMSNMRSYVSGIKIDDYGNTKLDYVDLAPSDWIIQICNNIKRYAVMADLANKGKVSIEPAVVAITTNVEDLLAHQVSNEPVSIGRRAHVHFELKVRPEFCKYDDLGNLTHMLDPLKVFKKYGDSTEIQDIWLVTVREIIIIPNTGSGNKRVAPSFRFENKQGLTDVSIFDALNYVVKEARDHFKVQEALVKQNTDLAAKIPWCDECSAPSQLCNCQEELEPQFGLRLASHVKSIGSRWGHELRRTQLSMETRVEDFAVDKLVRAVQWFENSPYAKWTNYVPTSLLSNEFILGLVMSTGVDVIKADVKSITVMWWMITAFLFLISFSFSMYLAWFVFVSSGLMFLIYYSTIIEYAKSAYYKRLMNERDVMPIIFKDIREKHMQYVCGAIAGFSLIYGAVKFYKALKSTLNVQGNLNPSSISDLKNRDSEQNVWKVPERVDPGVDKRVGSDDRFFNRVSKNQWYLELHREGRNIVCNALCVKTGYFLIPKHMLPSEITKITLSQKGYRLPAILDPDAVFKGFEGDLVLMYVPNAPDAKDLSGYFAADYERSIVRAEMVYTRADGSHLTDTVYWQFRADVYNGAEHFRGSYYKLTNDSFAGLCMATFFSKTVHSCILGVHLGGIEGKRDGCAMALCRPEILHAISELQKSNTAFIDTPQTTEITGVTLGEKFETDNQELHKKSPLNFIPEDSPVLVYGNVTGRASYQSSVTPTPISDIVEDVTGVPNTWGPPKFKSPNPENPNDMRLWRPWYESLQYSSAPSVGFGASLVQRAADDYISDLKDKYDSQSEFWKSDIKPLTDVQTISGIDGKRFIDSMPSGTSMGFPVGGPKRNHLVELNPDDYDDISCPRIFEKFIMDEYHSSLEAWESGNMVNPIFGASLKDEPTPLSKDKVRVFQAAPVILQMALRKYFLPVARFLSMNPLVSECAVGINSAGPEWEQLADHMRKFGTDRIIAGDYSKYDLRMPAQLTQAAFGIMMEIASWTGNYSAKDFKIMNSIAYEVTNPLVNFNGDLIRFSGTNPSGQNLTVYVNSIVNSLLHRLGFFHAYPTQESFGSAGEKLRAELGRDIRFRDIVSLATYGDDAKGSVMSGFDEFNHISFANFLADNDMKFTMPDKESDPVAFMDDDRADFLKRKNRFDDDLGHTVGMLDEKSIFKSLHSILKSKVQRDIDVATQNVDGALREWFFHGRDVFEHRRRQMQEIAHRGGLMCMTLDQDFDDRVAEWKEKYE
ncbi:hypothetical protein 1 [Beihai picorna-like virus 7]|uniref:hypothetical protein 1 n=1 Tax=Beihai picorna-like virus 7 TaxID=1922616 RepID=UPI000909750A|nr:hypothetical protein 1 [Beihai picorna-like virus 7]APG76855.1 hypothetical protein 1 [Beihai picorna-like virus 7]